MFCVLLQDLATARAGYDPDPDARSNGLDEAADSEEATATGNDAPDDGAETGIMAGLIDAEVVVEAGGPTPGIADMQEQSVWQTLDVIRNGGVIASCTGSGLVSDFDPQHFVKTHPTSFPYGAGGVPKGMGLATYARILVERDIGRPADEGGENVMLQLALFNVLQRRTALAETRARMKGRPDDFRPPTGSAIK